jgi:hypothetical protein
MFKQRRRMESSELMFKNIIILTLLWVWLFNVSPQQFFTYLHKGLDKVQEIVYSTSRSVKN